MRALLRVEMYSFGHRTLWLLFTRGIVSGQFARQVSGLAGILYFFILLAVSNYGSGSHIDNIHLFWQKSPVELIDWQSKIL